MDTSKIDTIDLFRKFAEAADSYWMTEDVLRDAGASQGLGKALIKRLQDEKIELTQSKARIRELEEALRLLKDHHYEAKYGFDWDKVMPYKKVMSIINNALSEKSDKEK